MKLTFVTCTGGRPELFALCRRWVLRQTLQPTRWIVTTDADDQPHAPEAEVFAVPKDLPLRKDLNHSPALRSLLYAMSLVEDDSAVVVIEDDDWYGPDYAKTLIENTSWCSHQGRVALCHLPMQRFSESAYLSPVEGMLAFRSGHKERIVRWLAHHPRPELPSTPVAFTQLVQVKGVGYGLPGRAGQTRKHKTNHKKTLGMQSDPGNTRFRELVGPDADAYLSLLQTP